jgi:hypothetical protein
MKRGADVGIVELRPKDLIDEEKNNLKKRSKETTLRKRAEFINVILSPEGKKLVELVVKKMEKRIACLISQDPEAKAYKNILEELKNKQNLARNAINQIYEAQFKEE